MQPVIESFGGSLSVMKNLRQLNLAYSNLNDALCKSLAENVGKGLTKINLKSCSLTSAGLDPLLEKLMTVSNTTLSTLNLSGNQMQGITFLGKFLSRSQSLEVLKLSACCLSDQELK
jgi:Ran GTPase-activating protein (RanGAP) involved in mRNA processing and transport